MITGKRREGQGDTERVIGERSKFTNTFNKLVGISKSKKEDSSSSGDEFKP